MGATLALLLLLAPVARYLPDAAAAYPVRAKMFWSGWHNQSVFNLLYLLRPSIASAGRYLFVGVGCTATGVAWLRLRRAIYSGDSGAVLAIHLTLFSTAALGVVVGFSRNSMAYNAVLSLPGALLIALTQAHLLPRASSVESSLMGGWIALSMFGLCAFSVPLLVGRVAAHDGLPTHGAALLALLLLVAVISIRGLVSRA